MSKQLSMMSKEELWKLFPIILTKHDDNWKLWYEEEYQFLSCILADYQVIISHIGSSAIAKIWAKPIIDILVEIPLDCDMQKIKTIIQQNGYLCMSEDARRISFNKGYTIDGFDQKVFHLHLRYYNDNDELYFRDYLNDYLDQAKEYEKLKLSLWKKYEYDRDGYTQAKTKFVRGITSKAKQLYLGRYHR